MKKKIAAQLAYDPQQTTVRYVPEQWVGEGQQQTTVPIRMTEEFLVAMGREADVPEEVRDKLDALLVHAKKTEEVWNGALQAFQMYVDARGGSWHLDENNGVIVFDFS